MEARNKDAESFTKVAIRGRCADFLDTREDEGEEDNSQLGQSPLVISRYPEKALGVVARTTPVPLERALLTVSV